MKKDRASDLRSRIEGMLQHVETAGKTETKMEVYREFERVRNEIYANKRILREDFEVLKRKYELLKRKFGI